MDLTLLAPALLPLLGQLKPLLVGAVLAALVQAAKQADAVTVLPADNATRIKGVAAFLSFLAAVLVAYADGNLASLDWTAAADVIVTYAMVALSSAGTWALALKGKTFVK